MRRFRLKKLMLLVPMQQVQRWETSLKRWRLKNYLAKAYQIPITANKSMLGHMLGAAGGVEAIALAKSLKEGIIPPTINLEKPDSLCDLDYVPGVARQVKINTVYPIHLVLEVIMQLLF